LLLYTGGVAEAAIRRDIIASHLAEMQRAFLFGDSGGANPNEPVGLLKKVPVAAFPSASLTAERSDLLKFIGTIENSALAEQPGVTLRWFMPNPYRRQLRRRRSIPTRRGAAISRCCRPTTGGRARRSAGPMSSATTCART
jgi:hypothetical protein